jgi:hypothetical protein
MLVLVEEATQTLAPSYVQAGDLVRVADRRGQWMEPAGAREIADQGRDLSG